MRKVEKTRQRLKRGALELFVRQGISETTTKQIAAHCEMSEGNIYRHYASKEDLARELLSDQMTRISDALKDAIAEEQPLKETILTLVRAYCRTAEEDWLGFSYHLKFQYDLLSGISLEPEHSPVDVLRGIVQKAVDRGDIPSRPVELILGMALGVVMQTAVQILYDRLDGPLEKYSEELADAVWRVIQGDGAGS